MKGLKGDFMTMNEIRESYKRFIQYELDNIKWYEKEIKYISEQIKESKASDKELVEYVWSKGPLTKWDMDHYNEKYVSFTTKKLLSDRSKCYYRIKRAKQSIARDEKLVEKYS